MTGRRRVGKTTLIEQFLSEAKLKSFYFFVSKKRAAILLNEFKQILSDKIPLISSVSFLDFDSFFKFLFDYLRDNPAIIVFDEFQNFDSVDPSVFSVFQKYWDANLNRSKGMFICIGSAFTMMKRLFEDSNEPLFGRSTSKLFLKPFSVSALDEMLTDNDVPQKGKALLDLFTLFGGIPKYYHLLDIYDLFKANPAKIIEELILSDSALLKNEGKDLLIEEFGKNYSTYFSILLVIAMGYSQMSDIAAQTGISINSIGKYLGELLNYYQTIDREIPVSLGYPKTKLGRYLISDPFLNFWFKYVFRNSSNIEMSNFKPVLRGILDDMDSYKGFVFEKIAREIVMEMNTSGRLPVQADVIGRYWNRTGQVEIDIVAADKKKRGVLFIECKMNSNAISEQTLTDLQQKVDTVEWRQKVRKKYFGIFTLNRLPEKMRRSLTDKGCVLLSLEDDLI